MKKNRKIIYVIIYAIIFLGTLIIFLLTRSKGMIYIGENEQMERVRGNRRRYIL